MKFFEKARPEVFLHSAKYRRDKKTQKRIWGFTLIVTMSEQLAKCCAVPVVKNFRHISDPEAAAVDVLLAGEVTGCAVDFFAQIDGADPALHLDSVDLTGLRMTRDKTIVEFWFSGEHENTDGLHAFMKKFAYTRCWAQFSPQEQRGEIAALPMRVWVIERKMKHLPAWGFSWPLKVYVRPELALQAVQRIANRFAEYRVVAYVSS